MMKAQTPLRLRSFQFVLWPSPRVPYRLVPRFHPKQVLLASMQQVLKEANELCRATCSDGSSFEKQSSRRGAHRKIPILGTSCRQILCSAQLPLLNNTIDLCVRYRDFQRSRQSGAQAQNQEGTGRQITPRGTSGWQPVTILKCRRSEGTSLLFSLLGLACVDIPH